jgi:hypothetical protein
MAHMTHLEIYNVLFKAKTDLLNWLNDNNVGSNKPVDCLYKVMVIDVQSVLSRSCDTLKNKEEFCVSCFHINLNECNRAVNRYKEIEKDRPEFAILDMGQVIMKSIITEIYQQYILQKGVCKRIKNTAYTALNN